jgi:hypothetical protein
LTAEVASLSIDTLGRDRLVGGAVLEDPVATKVHSSENAGKTLVDHFTVRSFAQKIIRLERTGTKTLTPPQPRRRLRRRVVPRGDPRPGPKQRQNLPGRRAALGHGCSRPLIYRATYLLS